MVNEKGAYIIQQGQKKELSGEELDEIKSSAVPFDELSLINKPTISLEGIEVYNDADTYVIKDGNAKYFYDVKTGLKVAEIKSMDVGGQLISQTSNFSDYREVNGIKIPFVNSINIGMEILLATTDVKINEGVSDADFQ